MKTNSALEKALARAAEIAAKTGQSLTPVDVKSIPTVVEYEKEKEEKRENKMIAFEGVSLQLHHKHQLMVKKCRWCKQAFQTGYCYVSLCSDACRAEEFRQVYGIEMRDVDAPAPFWEYEKPLLLPPEVLANLVSWARGLVEKYDEVVASEPPGRMAAIPPEVREEATTLQSNFRQSQISETLNSLESVEFSEPVADNSSFPESQQEVHLEQGDAVPANPQKQPDTLELEDFSFGDL